MIGGMEVVKAYGREEKVVEVFDEINEKIENLLNITGGNNG